MRQIPGKRCRHLILERIPMRRIAPADEIARAVLVFLGDDTSYVNGAVIDIDGGYAAG